MKLYESEGLNLLYNHLNEEVFSSELSVLPVYLADDVDFNGATHCRANGDPFQIAISREYVKKASGLDDIISTLLHEMIHVYCIEKGIAHFDKVTGTHTKEFCEAAEAHGLFYDDFTNDNFLI